ncbi:MAG: CD225/dispanin family protein [Deltaproteobacteria bacterium]|nr:CD225/dispanin family protein [Candidatus Zymogenaceae bacterium]
MICSSCGQANADGDRKCSGCGAELSYDRNPTIQNSYLPNYLAPAVILTFICCMPLGAVALIFAAQVNGRQIAGQWQEAKKSSESARLWCWIAFGAGIVFWTFYIIIIVIIMILGSKGRM